MADKIKLTKDRIKKLPVPESGRVDYFDTELRGFGVRVSKTKKVYIVFRRVNGKLSRVTLGPTNTMDVEEARREAENIIAGMNRGVDANSEKRKARQGGMTLGEVFSAYLEARTLKENTVNTYTKLLNYHLGDWLRLPIAEITPDMIARRHKKVLTESGAAPANNCMRTLRAIYNHGLVISPELPENPVGRLSKGRQWAKVGRRTTRLSKEDMPVWYQAVNAYDNPIVKDYLLLLLFTGLRREEAATLRWENVDMRDRLFTAVDTKNHSDHTLPMSEAVFSIFECRRAVSENEYVFPGRGTNVCLRDPRKAIVKIKKETGIAFCNHDLRRTFSSIAEGCVSYSVLKKIAESFR